ncbi:MAG: hypothetical protein H0V24_02120, partial [Chloroflexia bacterium]|nr:hypothetical protein [Chloroflexia bacterium]
MATAVGWSVQHAAGAAISRGLVEAAIGPAAVAPWPAVGAPGAAIFPAGAAA